jgi:hypothetical protein
MSEFHSRELILLPELDFQAVHPPLARLEHHQRAGCRSWQRPSTWQLAGSRPTTYIPSPIIFHSTRIGYSARA